MGFTTPVLPDMDPEELLALPLMERIRIMTLKWVDHGYGVPRMVHVLYLTKRVFFYSLGGIVIATATSDLPAFWHVSAWWDQPIVYQKAILWTVLLELLGLAGSWGPLAGKTKPMTGGYRFWARPNTIRLRPWKRVHGEDLIRAIQSEAQFEPGEFVITWVESQPIHRKIQEYKSIDAALGVIERGTWNVADVMNEQPWLPNGLIPLNVTWTLAKT